MNCEARQNRRPSHRPIQATWHPARRPIQRLLVVIVTSPQPWDQKVRDRKEKTTSRHRRGLKTLTPDLFGWRPN